MQCIESCRFFSFDYAVANKLDGACSCSRQSAATVSGPLPHQCTDAMKHEIYSVATITESPTCDHLYFRKHVYAPGDYKVGTQIKNYFFLHQIFFARLGTWTPPASIL